jgi:hypothetical protein
MNYWGPWDYLTQLFEELKLEPKRVIELALPQLTGKSIEEIRRQIVDDLLGYEDRFISCIIGEQEYEDVLSPVETYQKEVREFQSDYFYSSPWKKIVKLQTQISILRKMEKWANDEDSTELYKNHVKEFSDAYWKKLKDAEVPKEDIQTAMEEVRKEEEKENDEQI